MSQQEESDVFRGDEEARRAHVARCERLMQQMIERMAERTVPLPAMHVERSARGFTGITGLPLPLFNLHFATVDDGTLDTDEQLRAHLLERFSSRHLAWAIYLSECTRPASLHERLVRAVNYGGGDDGGDDGTAYFQASECVTAMVLDLADPSIAALYETERARYSSLASASASALAATALRIDETRGDCLEALLLRSRALLRGFEIADDDDSLCAAFAALQHGTSPHALPVYRLFTGSVRGADDVERCVCTGACSEASECDGAIFEITTLREHRRRGHCMQMMVHLVECLRAANPARTRIYLKATQVGRPAYAKLGFRSVGQFTVLMHFPPAVYRRMMATRVSAADVSAAAATAADASASASSAAH